MQGVVRVRVAVGSILVSIVKLKHTMLATGGSEAHTWGKLKNTTPNYATSCGRLAKRGDW